jgi:phosphoesterase RecJ-like protein
MMLLGAALSNLRRDGRISWMWVTHEDMLRTNAAEEDCEGLVNYAIAIAGVDVAIFLRELSNHRVRLSIRSKGNVNVANIAERFGGGGHQHASGCTIDGPLPEAAEMILNVARHTLIGAIHEVA